MNSRNKFFVGSVLLLIAPMLMIFCQQSQQNQVSLHDAVQQDNVELVASLIQSGADVHALNDNEQTPLQLALMAKFKFVHSVDMARLLIQAGADVYQQDKDGLNSLQKAIKTRQVSMVEMFIASGFNINFQSAENGFTPLHQVIHQSAVMVINHYLEISQCGSCLTNKYPKDLIIAQILIQAGVDVTIKNQQGHTVLQMLDVLFNQINPVEAGIVISEYNYFDTQDIIVPACCDMDLEVKGRFAELAQLFVITDENQLS